MKKKQNLNKSTYYAKELNARRFWQFWKPKYKLVEVSMVEVGLNAGGRITRANKKPVYNLELPRGGKVVKSMPKSLRKIKEAQEQIVEE